MQPSHMIPGVTIISRKVSAASINKVGGSETPAGPQRKILGSKEHLNWLKLNLNAALTITIQDCTRTKLM